MKQQILRAASLALIALAPAFADLTMKYSIDFKFGSFLPPQATQTMQSQFGPLPAETVVAIRGDKVYTSMGRMTMITDYAKGVITLLDPQGHKFGTTPLSSYGEKIAAAQKLPQIPAAVQQMFQNVKIDAKTEKTGKTETIQGIRGEEMLLTMNMDIPSPVGPGMQMRMEMHRWMAAPDEVKRLPALGELAVYMRAPKLGIDPTEMATKALAGFPGLAEKMKGAMEEIAKNATSPMLRIHTAIFMPSMAMLMGQAASDQPFTEYNMELKEFSGAPVPDSRFEVPADYASASVEDMIATLFPAPKPPIPNPPPPQSSRPVVRENLPEGVFHAGNGVTPPQIVWQEQPGYTEEARAAKISGTVLLSVIVGPDGVPQQVKVLRSLEPGLDRSAVDKVSTWKFKPGMKDGRPVAVQATIEVNFRLM